MGVLNLLNYELVVSWSSQKVQFLKCEPAKKSVSLMSFGFESHALEKLILN